MRINFYYFAPLRSGVLFVIAAQPTLTQALPPERYCSNISLPPMKNTMKHGRENIFYHWDLRKLVVARDCGGN
jgi:hypothetical protein